jgi:hypothetical protein
VAVLPPHHNLQGDVTRVVDQIRSDVAAALDEAGYAALPAERAETCMSGEPGAPDAQRLTAVATGCEAQAAAGMSIEASAMGYALHLVIVGADGTAVADVEGTCDFCTEGEMVAKWPSLVSEAGAPPPALVAAAGGPIEGPIEPPVGPGEGAGEGEGEGEGAGEGEGEGEESTFSVSDIPWWAWAGGAASLAAIGVGIPLIVIDGDPTCDGPLESCPEIYDTDAIGYTLLAVGIAGLGAVGVGLYFALSDDDDEQTEATTEPSSTDADVAILPSVGGIVLQGIF